MDAVNGDVGKRKRELTPKSEELRATNETWQYHEDFGEILKDLLQILSKYDSGLGLLQHPLPPQPDSEPDSKRPKLSQAEDGAKTIASRVLSGEYKSLQSFVDDVEAVEESMVAERRQPDTPLAGRPTSPAALPDRTRIFKGHMNDLIRRHPFKLVPQGKRESQEQGTQVEERLPTIVPRDDKLVLTVLGSGARPRQLFSGLQKSRDNTLSGIASLAISESRLPGGIAAAKVVPFNTVTLDETKNRTRTLGEVFAPRSALPLEPPRKREQKGPSILTWINPLDAAPSAASGPGEKKYYSSTTVPAARWVNYGYELPASQRTVRKYHKPTDTANVQEKASQRSSKPDNKLFRGIYSSFAPSLDSAGSVVAPDIKAQTWLTRSSARRLRTIVSADAVYDDTAAEDPHIPLDPELLKDCVESFVPEPVDPAMADEKVETSDDADMDRDAEEILQDISELLRTLDSYRQLRNLKTGTTATDPRDSPSDAEFEIYQTLKSSLAAMIATLPPYAVAKLDGNRLEELSISTKVLVDNVDYPGTMDEDEYSLHQRQVAKLPQTMAAARMSTPNVSRTPPAISYQRAPSRAKPPSNFQPPQGYVNRAVSSGHYQPNGTPQQATPLQPTAQRPAYVPQPQYSQPGTPQPQTRAGILQQFQKSSQNGNTPNLAQRGPSPARPPSQPYQPRVNYQPNAFNTPVAGPRSASPQKPGMFAQSPQPAASPYMSPTPSNNQPRYFDQNPRVPTPVSYPNFTANQGSPVGPQYSNPSGQMPYPRSAAEQAALMERNKAQLIEPQRPGSRMSQTSHNP